MKPVPLATIIAYLETEVGLARSAKRWWRAKVFEQAAALLRRSLPT